MRIKKRIHYLLQQIMNSYSELFPSKIQLYINTSEYGKSKHKLVLIERMCLIYEETII